MIWRGSRPIVGSSRTSTGGSWISAWARPTRWRKPFERWPSRRPRTSVEPQVLEHPLDRVRRSARGDAFDARDEAQVGRHRHVAVERRVLGQVADPPPHLERLSKTSKPSTVTVPLVAGMKPVMMRMVVVLPAPLGPRKPRISPLARGERDVADRGEVAVALGQVANLDHPDRFDEHAARNSASA